MEKTNISDFQQLAFDWFVAHGLAIIAILVGAYIAHLIIHAFIERTIRQFVKPVEGAPPESERKREDTLIRIFHNMAVVILWVVAGIMALAEAGINVTPIVAAAGVAGLAFGFGGQYLIRDVISGFFIIMENQYRIGDVACLDSTCGLVEDITLRATILRDLDGTVHHVPNGTINRASNLSKVYARVNLNIGVAYSSDIDHVIKVVNQVGKDLAEDPKWKPFIIKAPEFLRIDSFDDSAITIKILGDTQPIKQWDVSGELRKRLKVAFDKEGIEIPFPQRVIHSVRGDAGHGA